MCGETNDFSLLYQKLAHQMLASVEILTQGVSTVYTASFQGLSNSGTRTLHNDIIIDVKCSWMLVIEL